jgi:2-iminobutanoate/2-iminopropanoate deaminase
LTNKRRQEEIMWKGIVAALMVFVAACGGKTGPERPVLEFKASPQPMPGPFSPAVRVGNLLFLAGALGTDAKNALVPGGIEAETRQSLENIRAELARHGLAMGRVAKCTVILADMGEWGRMNSVYETFFPGPKPARTAFGASGLALGARVEIECIAAVE